MIVQFFYETSVSVEKPTFRNVPSALSTHLYLPISLSMTTPFSFLLSLSCWPSSLNPGRHLTMFDGAGSRTANFNEYISLNQSHTRPVHINYQGTGMLCAHTANFNDYSNRLGSRRGEGYPDLSGSTTKKNFLCFFTNKTLVSNN